MFVWMNILIQRRPKELMNLPGWNTSERGPIDGVNSGATHANGNIISIILLNICLFKRRFCIFKRMSQGYWLWKGLKPPWTLLFLRLKLNMLVSGRSSSIGGYFFTFFTLNSNVNDQWLVPWAEERWYLWSPVCGVQQWWKCPCLQAPWPFSQ